MKNYNIEKFSNGDVKISFNFTTKANNNGVVFDALEVFDSASISKAKADKNHDFNYKNYQDGVSFSLIKNEIKDSTIYHNVECFITNEEAKKVVLSADFKGFSANIKPLKAPEPSRTANPRYYGSGAMQLEAFTFITKGTPAFIGGDKFLIETFSNDDTEVFAIVEKKEVEKFYNYNEVGDLVIYNNLIGKITSIASTETEVSKAPTKTITIELLDKTSIVITDSSSDINPLRSARLGDIFDYLQVYNNVNNSMNTTTQPNEGFAETTPVNEPTTTTTEAPATTEPTTTEAPVDEVKDEADTAIEAVKTANEETSTPEKFATLTGTLAKKGIEKIQEVSQDVIDSLKAKIG